MGLKTLLAVDLSSVAVAAYYATGDETTFFEMIARTATELRITHIVFAADTPDGSSSRKEILKEYKGNRVPNPERDLYVSSIATRLMADGFVVVGGQYEADDYLNSIVQRAKPIFDRVYVLTNDQDLLALVEETVFVVARHRGRLVIKGETEVFNALGIYPTQYTFWKSLVGDSSDNLAGVRGIGPVAASELVKKYNNLDSLYASVESIAPKLRRLLVLGRDMAYDTYKVVQLQSPELPFEFTLRDMRYGK